MNEPFNFNVLTDPWVPLKGPDGMRRVSVVDLLCDPSCDAAEMGHPREDFGFLARVLLSAITHSLFRAPDLSTLERRMEGPLTRAEVDPVVEQYRVGFNLLGSRAFLQPAGVDGANDNETARLLLDVSGTSRPKLHRHDRDYPGLCPACMTVALFGAQLLAAAGGRGYCSALRGPSSLFTLVWRPSVRETTWANTLVGVADRNAAVEPWRGVDLSTPITSKRRRDSLNNTPEGMFWQPRTIQCRKVDEGPCPTCGIAGVRLGAFGYGAGQGDELGEGSYRDPWLPVRVDRERSWGQSTPKDKPIWTGLADMLERTRGTNTTEARPTYSEAAGVVRQQLDGLMQRVQLLVFGQSTDNASLTGRFAETLSVSMGREGSELVILAAIRGCVATAEECLNALIAALKQAWSNRDKSKTSYWPEDARATFWQRTETAFVREKKRIEADDPASIPSTWAQDLLSINLDIFDANTEGAAIDPRRADFVAHARKTLRIRTWRALHPKENKS